VFFIKENFHDIFIEAFDLDFSKNYVTIFCFIIFTLLCLVRKIEKFAITHLFADAMIVLTLIVVVIYGSINLKNEGS